MAVANTEAFLAAMTKFAVDCLAMKKDSWWQDLALVPQLTAEIASMIPLAQAALPELKAMKSEGGTQAAQDALSLMGAMIPDLEQIAAAATA